MNKFNVLFAAFAIFSAAFVQAVPEPPCESEAGQVIVNSNPVLVGASNPVLVGSNINGGQVLASGLSNSVLLSNLGPYGGYRVPAHKVVLHEQSKPLDVQAKGTKVEVSHPALTVSAKPVVVKRKPDVVVSPIFVHKQLPPIRIRQLYVKKVQPVENIVVSKAVSHNVHSGWLHSGLWNGNYLGDWNGANVGAWNDLNLGHWNGAHVADWNGKKIVTSDCSDGHKYH